MKLNIKIAAITLGCLTTIQPAFAQSYGTEDPEQLTLECLLTNNKYASAFISQDVAGYAFGTPASPTAELNLVTNQHGVTAYYNSGMIAGGSLYWIRIVKGAYEYIVYDKEQHGDMSGVVVTKNGKTIFHKDCKEPIKVGTQNDSNIFSRVAQEDTDSERIIDLINK
ncbi:hypothetical protein F8538_14050 [Edwardsiella ictaluri]|uniref:hypothetical protein n=1 Tax=Edwardsiella ictaluri TaxID=67780 RepID=UPI0009C0AFA4|nr:hypothetical protein [Edwardsiella ictaluri]ARD39354.1 hypothetical protein B6E78_08160 [Edwardsiella ictaluri]QPW27778.1 hypothetical protein F8538_14050 [Edwardsiella ictaluri]